MTRSIPDLLYPPGSGEDEEANTQMNFRPSYPESWEEISQIDEANLEVAEEEVKLKFASLKSAKQVNINIDGKHCQNNEAAGASGGSFYADDVAEEVQCPFDLVPSELADQVNVNVDGNHCQNREPTGAGGSLYVGEQCDHPQCSMNKSKDRFLEGLLMVISFLLLFATAGAFYFTRTLAIVGNHDPVLKHNLTAFKCAFAASFFSNFLGLFAFLILQSRREYHQYKKISLIISNTASFLLMVLGYGLVIAFNTQRR